MRETEGRNTTSQKYFTSKHCFSLKNLVILSYSGANVQFRHGFFPIVFISSGGANVQSRGSIDPSTQNLLLKGSLKSNRMICSYIVAVGYGHCRCYSVAKWLQIRNRSNLAWEMRQNKLSVAIRCQCDFSCGSYFKDLILRNVALSNRRFTHPKQSIRSFSRRFSSGSKDWERGFVLDGDGMQDQSIRESDNRAYWMTKRYQIEGLKFAIARFQLATSIVLFIFP
ncbi:hypothetical protein YC2023_005090 [Brassica napus]